MIKFFVPDTDVVFHDPVAPCMPKDGRVVIPGIVIEERDRFEKDLSAC
jgi:predicted ribonuclease YlaK